MSDSKVYLTSALQNFVDVGGTHFSSAINMAIDQFSSADLESETMINRIFFLSDGVPEDADDTDDLINEAVNRAAVNNITIYTFGLGVQSGDAYLENIAQATGGEFHKVIEASDLTYTIGNISFPNPNLGYLIDSDGDGIPDIIELYGLRPNGQLIGTDPNLWDTDGDGISDGEEIGFASSAYEAFLMYFKGVSMSISDIIREMSKWLFMRSSPTIADTDGDGLLDGNGTNKWGWSNMKDPEPLKKNNFIPFGADEYMSDLEKLVKAVYDYSGTRDFKFVVQKLMDEVNDAEYYKLIPFNAWSKFCDSFNAVVQINNDVWKDLHYFRNKLNRTPENLEEMIKDKNNWLLMSVPKSMYHMIGTNGEHNLKFVSTCGKFEAVYNYAGVLLDEERDPKNMGTYNYCGSGSFINDILHWAFDIVPYEKWGNTAGIGRGLWLPEALLIYNKNKENSELYWELMRLTYNFATI